MTVHRGEQSTISISTRNASAKRITQILHSTLLPKYLLARKRLDAADGFHSVEVDEESQHLLIFITEWGRYMPLRLPQGYSASGDAYTHRMDNITKDAERKLKIVDDSLLYDYSIEESFFHTWDYLTLCAENGIVDIIGCDFTPWAIERCPKTCGTCGLSIRSDEPENNEVYNLKHLSGALD